MELVSPEPKNETNLVARVRDKGKGNVRQVLGEALGGGRGSSQGCRGPHHH